MGGATSRLEGPGYQYVQLGINNNYNEELRTRGEQGLQGYRNRTFRKLLIPMIAHRCRSSNCIQRRHNKLGFVVVVLCKTWTRGFQAKVREVRGVFVQTSEDDAKVVIGAHFLLYKPAEDLDVPTKCGPVQHEDNANDKSAIT